MHDLHSAAGTNSSGSNHIDLGSQLPQITLCGQLVMWPKARSSASLQVVKGFGQNNTPSGSPSIHFQQILLDERADFNSIYGSEPPKHSSYLSRANKKVNTHKSYAFMQRPAHSKVASLPGFVMKRWRRA